MGKRKTATCAAPFCKKKIGRHSTDRVDVMVTNEDRRGRRHGVMKATMHQACADRLGMARDIHNAVRVH